MPVQGTNPQGSTARQTTSDAGTGPANPLLNVTVAQAEAWIDTNVTSLAGAVVAFKKLIRLVLPMRDTLVEQQALIKQMQADIAALKKKAG